MSSVPAGMSIAPLLSKSPDRWDVIALNHNDVLGILQFGAELADPDRGDVLLVDVAQAFRKTLGRLAPKLAVWNHGCAQTEFG